MIRVVATVAVSLMLSGCFVELLGATAIQGQLAATQAQGAAKQLEKAREFSAETTLRQAIDVYTAEKGAYPPSLQALVPDYMAEIPSKADGSPYGYDPETGALLEAPLQPSNITTADYRKLDQLRAAIYQYGQEVTWYPATLADLVPKYYPEYPLTSDGREFVYNAQTGTVEHPDNIAPPPAPVPHRGLAGQAAPPAGAAGRAANQPVGGAYSNKQMEMVEELGF